MTTTIATTAIAENIVNDNSLITIKETKKAIKTKKTETEKAEVPKKTRKPRVVKPKDNIVIENRISFDINKRFEFVKKLVKMVASGIQASAIITGEGGVGKTFTVTKTLEEMGYKNICALSDSTFDSTDMDKYFITVKGHSTAKGLYRTLFENRKAVVVFDDCDSVLKDPISLNILKSALDSYNKRTISWNADMRDDDLPRSFNFEGGVIFISNIEQHKIAQSIKSRSMMIDLSMTIDQKIERMEFMVKTNEFLPKYSNAIKKDALNLIRDIKDDIKEINLRTLITVCKVRASNTDYKELAIYMLTM